jgi:hypothetical protein
MPQRSWSDKRERQYEHIKAGLKRHGRGEDVAEDAGIEGRSKMNKAQLARALARRGGR